MTYLQVVPAKLCEARLAINMTQRQLAATADLSPSYVAMIESGRRLRISEDAAARLATALHLDDISRITDLN